jgi:HD-like signal output (HDOD) protein
MLPGFDLERLQQQGQQVAAIARALAAGTAFADDAMLAGLMHNIGYWVLVQECPRELQQAWELARERKIPMHEAERELMGASYAEVGAYLLGIWGLPRPVIEAVAFQRRSEQLVHTNFDVLSALVVAEALAFGQGPDAFGMQQPPPRVIDDTYLGPLQAPFDWREAQLRAEAAMGEPQA